MLPNPRLLGIAAIVLGSFMIGWTVRGWKEDAVRKAALEEAQVRFEAKLAVRDSEHIQQLTVTQRREAVLMLEVDTYRAESDRLRAVTRRVPLVRIVTEKVNESCSCSESRLSRGFGLCFTAGIGGESSAVAACSASGGDAVVPSSF